MQHSCYSVRHIHKHFAEVLPATIVDTGVLVVGISLYDVAINYVAGGQGAMDYGSWQNWLLAFTTLGAVLYLSFFTKGIRKLASILIGVAIGCVIACA